MYCKDRQNKRISFYFVDILNSERMRGQILEDKAFPSLYF